MLEDPDHADDSKVVDEDVIRHGVHGTVGACLMTLQPQPLLRIQRLGLTVPNESSQTYANLLSAPADPKVLADCVGRRIGWPHATS